jgi:hypothetical protein
VFGIDWLGRYLGHLPGEDTTLIVEAHSGGALEAPFDAAFLHAVELHERGERFVEGDLWRAWREHNPAPRRDQCVGLDVPQLTLDGAPGGGARIEVEPPTQ